eukprot:sb/3467226/
MNRNYRSKGALGLIYIALNGGDHKYWKSYRRRGKLFQRTQLMTKRVHHCTGKCPVALGGSGGTAPSIKISPVITNHDSETLKFGARSSFTPLRGQTPVHRFMGGRPPDKKSYLAPFSRYLHIYAPIHNLMHILNINTSGGPRTFSWTYIDSEWSIYGGSSPGQKVVSRTARANMFWQIGRGKGGTRVEQGLVLKPIGNEVTPLAQEGLYRTHYPTEPKGSRRALLSCSLSLTSCILIGCYLSHVRSHRLSLCTRTYHVTFHVIRCCDPGPPTDKLRVLRNYTSLNSGAYHKREWIHHSLTLDVS